MFLNKLELLKARVKFKVCNEVKSQEPRNISRLFSL